MKKDKALDISKITDQLYIAALPSSHHAAEIKTLKVRLIINMTWTNPPPRIFNQPPFQALHLKTIDTPLTPLPLTKLRQGVALALSFIKNGEGVLVHCRKGRHRSVAMTACILIGLGYSAPAAMQLIKTQRQAADPYIFYIRWRITEFETWWLTQQANLNKDDKRK